MLQVSSSYSVHRKRWIGKIKLWTKKNCVWLEKHSSATCYNSNMRLSFSAFSFLRRHLSRLTECLKIFTACFETNAWLRFLVIGKHWKFWKYGLQKAYKQAYIYLMKTWHCVQSFRFRSFLVCIFLHLNRIWTLFTQCGTPSRASYLYFLPWST